ncbi:hypothetical protein SAMN05421505_1304 [Sinosporangium album]|uniref:S-adenosyl methyltransferase n=1 Tax=Sinosporangium album TaxID=504805 RepID=A0A1G8H0R4_9ACTN|nr:hypothetical protein [Sinosporangium album]SDI00111.1 hypothetical protein SAMN05421505_1304 [Sinosporangium album]
MYIPRVSVPDVRLRAAGGRSGPYRTGDALHDFWSGWSWDLAGAVASTGSLPYGAVLVGVGGRRNAVFAALLAMHGDCAGVVLDFDGSRDVIERQLELEGVAQRCDVVSAGERLVVPVAPFYLVAELPKRLPEPDTVGIVGAVGAAVPLGGRLVVLDTVLDELGPGEEHDFDGQPPPPEERWWMPSRYEGLLHPLGLRTRAMWTLESGISLLEFERSSSPAAAVVVAG